MDVRILVVYPPLGGTASFSGSAFSVPPRVDDFDGLHRYVPGAIGSIERILLVDAWCVTSLSGSMLLTPLLTTQADSRTLSRSLFSCDISLGLRYAASQRSCASASFCCETCDLVLWRRKFRRGSFTIPSLYDGEGFYLRRVTPIAAVALGTSSVDVGLRVFSLCSKVKVQHGRGRKQMECPFA